MLLFGREYHRFSYLGDNRAGGPVAGQLVVVPRRYLDAMSATTTPSPADRPRVEVRRSGRRRRTVAAHREGDTVVISVPATLTRAEEAQWVELMLERLDRRAGRRADSDDALLARAADLSRSYLDGLASPASVRWVDNQRSRWGSCTVADRSIRLSTRLRDMPTWVVDYVLVHELAHLLVPTHGPRFWEWVDRYPRTERARGYLEGVAATAGLAVDDEADAPG